MPTHKNPVKALRGLSKGMFKEDSVGMVRKLRKEWERRDSQVKD